MLLLELLLLLFEALLLDNIIKEGLRAVKYVCLIVESELTPLPGQQNKMCLGEIFSKIYYTKK